MKTMKFNFLKMFVLILSVTTFIACSDDDDNQSTFMGETKVYTLNSVADPNISGSATFRMNADNTTTVELDLNGTSSSMEMMPAHIHFNTAAEGGGIAISLNSVDPSTGMSTTQVSMLDDDNAITYNDLLEFDGYINVHASASDLGTLFAQGDIGQNELTGEMKTYALGSVTDPDISGEAVFSERVNGTALAELNLMGPTDGITFESHIHMNTAAEGGGIVLTFADIDGNVGSSKTQIEAFDDGLAFNYSDVLNYDGYINVHLKSDLSVLYAQGDIGQNELTGESKSYTLDERDVPGISGSVLFEERENGEAQATIMLDGTPDGGSHPAHIHMNTAAEGGGILYTFTPVDGTTGMSRSNVDALDDDSPFGYADVLEVDGYVNVHLSADDLGTLVSQGDIGQNELTGESTTYTLGEKDVPGINGDIVFEERVNGEALATISLVGTPAEGEHPAHIHANSASEGGPILLTFTPVDGATGMSKTNISALDDDTSFVYSDVLVVDGYVNVHLSMDDLGTIVAQGDIGSNM